MYKRRRCAQTGEIFEITPDDLAFYRRASPTFGTTVALVPPPTLCPEARTQRRLAWRNERTLYKRKCDLTGREIVSNYAAESLCPVYDHTEWFSDRWEPLDYGRPVDFSRPFFDQFQELMRVVPMFSLFQQQENENCPYANFVTRNRNCHYIFAGGDNEDCYYSTYIQRCSDSSDCFFCFDCQLSYECIDCTKCYELKHSQECDGCSQSAFLLGCTSCQYCFGCVSLLRQNYCFFQEQLTAEEYADAIASFCARPDWPLEAASRLGTIASNTPRKYYAGFQNEQCSGDHIIGCRNAQVCFDVTRLEDCKYCTWLHHGKDCYDCYGWGFPGELGLENHLCGNGFYRCIFSEECWNNVSDILYSRACHSGSKNLFGCIGLRAQQFCIFNKKYTEKEYNDLAVRLVSHMQETGEWGEFFPARLSPFGYNETVAMEYFPLTRAQVLENGWRFRDGPLPGVFGKETIDGRDIPATGDLYELLADETIACAETKKNFRYTTGELSLYRKLDVAPPSLCFDARYQHRLRKRNPRRLTEGTCSQCRQSLLTPIDDWRSKSVLCESCFLGSDA